MPDTRGSGADHGDDSKKHRRKAVSHARTEDEVVQLPVTTLLTRLRGRADRVTQEITRQVQTEVTSYAGGESGRRHQLITRAVREGIEQFFRTVAGKPISPTVDDLFRRMGYGEALEGHDLTALSGALRIATREAWDALRESAIELGLSAAALGELGDQLFGLIDHLRDQVAIGHELALRARDRDLAASRDGLIDALLSGLPMESLRTKATAAGWPLPREVVVISTTASGAVRWPDDDEFDGSVLLALDAEPGVAIASSESAQEVVQRLRLSGPAVRVAHSWAVAPSDAPAARRWTARALELVDSGVIPRMPVIDCAAHLTQLWLHSEPALRRQLAQELLQPLFGETPNSREILSQTLLVWLETRGSAPAIAAILGVHPQTVRYRWKRINELLGDILQDPETVLQLTMVLKASVPLWTSGNQEDFRLAREGEAR